MGLSTDIRNMFINLTGYFIYKKKDLPVGVDLKLDLDYKFGIATRCIFDVGANYGQTALHFLYEFPEATIYSFEPVRASFQVLVENTMKESKIKSFCLAFGERKQEIEISLFDEKQS